MLIKIQKDYKKLILLFSIFTIWVLSISNLILGINNQKILIYGDSGNSNPSIEDRLLVLKNDPNSSEDIKSQCASILTEIQSIKDKIQSTITKSKLDDIKKELDNNPGLRDTLLTDINHKLSLPNLDTGIQNQLKQMFDLIKNITDNDQKIMYILNDFLTYLSSSDIKIKNIISTYDDLNGPITTNQDNITKLTDINNSLSSEYSVSNSDLAGLKSNEDYAQINVAPLIEGNPPTPSDLPTFRNNVLQPLRGQIIHFLPDAFDSSSSVSSISSTSSSSGITTKQIILIVIIILFLFIIVVILIGILIRKKQYNHKKIHLNK
ncbi:MAG: hypothetical protein Q8888_01620 [Vigna little leaf phytoplasma]|nr:hypothetical protein [Vigna little leaf phytoplasma]